jgi:hypothetical protein
MSNRQGDNPPNKDEDDRLPPLVETVTYEHRPPPDPDPKKSPFKSWTEIAQSMRKKRDDDSRDKDGTNLRPIADRPATPRPNLNTFVNHQKSPSDSSDEETKVTSNATPNPQTTPPDGWSPLHSDSEGSENVVTSNSPPIGGETNRSVPLEEVTRNILQNMDDQLNALISPPARIPVRDNPNQALTGSTQNLLQPIGTSFPFGRFSDTKKATPPTGGHVFAQLGGTQKTSPTTDNVSGTTRTPLVLPTPRKTGIIDPSLIKRPTRDPNLIPEFGATYVPTTQTTNSGDSEPGIKSNLDDDATDPSDKASKAGMNPTTPNLNSGTGSDYNATRDQTPIDIDKGPSINPNAELIAHHTRGEHYSDPENALTAATLPAYVTGLDARFSKRLDNMSHNISRIFAEISRDHRQSIASAELRHRQVMASAEERNLTNFNRLQETLVTQAEAIQAQASESQETRRELLEDMRTQYDDSRNALDTVVNTIQSLGTVVTNMHAGLLDVQNQVTILSNTTSTRTTNAASSGGANVNNGPTNTNASGNPAGSHPPVGGGIPSGGHPGSGSHYWPTGGGGNGPPGGGPPGGGGPGGGGYGPPSGGGHGPPGGGGPSGPGGGPGGGGGGGPPGGDGPGGPILTPQERARIHIGGAPAAPTIGIPHTFVNRMTPNQVFERVLEDVLSIPLSPNLHNDLVHQGISTMPDLFTLDLPAQFFGLPRTAYSLGSTNRLSVLVAFNSANVFYNGGHTVDYERVEQDMFT